MCLVTRRGIFVRLALLCAFVSVPPREIAIYQRRLRRAGGVAPHGKGVMLLIVVLMDSVGPVRNVPRVKRLVRIVDSVAQRWCRRPPRSAIRLCHLLKQTKKLRQ